MTHRVYIGLGGNLDNPVSRLQQVGDEMDNMDWLSGYVQSSLYRTKPVGVADQPDFINAVAGFDTQLSPHDVLQALQEIENRYGRVRGGVQWGPRTIDLDILLYGNRVIDMQALTIPHPRMPERTFVLVPLAEIAPDLVIPAQRDTVRDMLALLDDSGVSLVERECS